MEKSSENRELSDGLCPCGCTDHIVYRWWPWTVEGLNHQGHSMVACEEFFHSVWAPEGEEDGEE